MPQDKNRSVNLAVPSGAHGSLLLLLLLILLPLLPCSSVRSIPQDKNPAFKDVLANFAEDALSAAYGAARAGSHAWTVRLWTWSIWMMMLMVILSSSCSNMTSRIASDYERGGGIRRIDGSPHTPPGWTTSDEHAFTAAVTHAGGYVHASDFAYNLAFLSQVNHLNCHVTSGLDFAAQACTNGRVAIGHCVRCGTL